MPELPAWAGTIKVRHLIHHTSGLPEGVEFDELHRAGLDRTTARVIQALVQIDHLDSTPGTRFRYCNSGYVCLAAVVERAAGQPLPDFARERVFQPLGMRGSRYWSGPAPHPPAALERQREQQLGHGVGGDAEGLGGLVMQWLIDPQNAPTGADIVAALKLATCSSGGAPVADELEASGQLLDER